MNQPLPAHPLIHGAYFQAEAKFSEGKTTVALGGELLDGNLENHKNQQVRSFDVLYGVALKFMGNMNFFTNFPKDVAGNGLIDPYFSTQYSSSKTLVLDNTTHLFYTRHLVYHTTHFGNGKQFLGIENDLKLKSQIGKAMSLQAGYSFLYLKNLCATYLRYKMQIVWLFGTI